MKTFTQSFCIVVFCLLAFVVPSAVQGQSILNPNDSVITYNSAAPPTQPAWNTIGKWVRTKRLSWNTTNFKCYIFNSYPFRLRYPKSYNPTANDGKKYPILIFFHGAGEGGTMFDNELSLAHGGNVFDTAVTNGTFDGYIFVMQTPNGFWGEPVYGYITQVLDYMIANNKLDPFRVSLNGLSAGGEGTWNFLFNHANYVADALPMSNCDLPYKSDSTLIKFTPMWIFQGGLDGAPDPGTTANVVAALQSAGMNIVETLFPNDGHDTWDDTWKQSGFWPFVKAGYMSNPWALFGHTQFCPGQPISATLGVVSGMQAYQWRYQGQIIPGATSNTYVATQLGTYDCQVERNGIWSDWSHVPVVISVKQPTVPPTITTAPLTSNVIPALDTSKGVTLQVPTGYATYLWQAVGGSTTLSSTNNLYTRTPGQYQVQVMEQFGCASSFSSPFSVVNANGSNGPSAPGGLQATQISPSALRLDWTVDPSQGHPQTGFEVYMGTAKGGPYKMVDQLGASAVLDTVKGLNPGATYYYVVRAVNGNAGSPASNEASGTTVADVQPPTAPGNLTVTGTTRSTVSLSWTASTDNVGVTSYDIYVNGVKNYSTTGTTFTVDNLQYPTSYAFAVVARDFAKNISPFSNQVSAEALTSGLTYKFYTFATAPTKLPDYGNTLAVKTGVSTTGLSLTPETQTKNLGFLWEGYLHITTAGNYTFRLTSVDGSALYLGSLNANGTPYNFGGTTVISNDGIHSSKSVNSSTMNLQVGVYPIAVAYFHGSSGSPSVSLQWSGPGISNFATVPSSAFADAVVAGGQAPAAPSNLAATSLSYNKIGLTWTDNSNNETGYEVWRSTSPTSGYTTIATVGTGVTSFTDSTLAANTAYYYEVRSINQYGTSTFVTNYTEAFFGFNNDYSDATGNGNTLTALNTPTFDGANKQEGSAAVKLNGTNQAITINNTNGFLQTAYSQRTIACWIRSSTNTNNRVIFDIGGSDNGLSLLLNSNTLIAGVASANSRSTISAAYTSTGWNHVALVYLGDSLMLYVNGVLAASKTNLTFHSIATTTNGSRIGQINGTIASNTGGTGLFNGWIDGFGVYNTGFGPDVVATIMNGTYQQSFAKTQALPAIPQAPTGLVAQGTSTSSTVTVHWTDNAVNETNYQVFRSAVNNGNFLLRATLPAGASSYKDTGLFSNAVYYYEVRAINLGGNSAFSNQDSAHTQDNLPTITAIASPQYMRYGTTLSLPVSATDVDAGTLNVQLTNLPAFGTFTPSGNGKGTITFNPDSTGQGVYNNITVTVTDANGGSASTSFSLTVNNNYPPVIARPVTGVSVNEKQTGTMNLTATDQNNDALSWTFTGLPGFATTSINGGAVSINLAPGYADGGSYTVQAKVDDGNHGVDTVSFVITVVQVPLPTTSTYIHFDGVTGTTAAAPWNNTATQPAQNVAFSNLLDQNGNSSGYSLTILTPWQSISFGDGTNVLGQTTGNNSGVYPDAVLNSGYYTDGTPQNIKVAGLDTTTKYNFTFFGTRGGVNDDRTSVYSLSGTYVNQTVSLNAASNTTNTVSINNVRPNADGTVTMTLAKGVNAPFGYMNALVITAQFNDHTAPAAPRSLTGQIVNNSSLSLTWIAGAYNANSYQVYRSTTLAGPYTLLNPGATNPTQASYVDTGLAQNSTYYYYATASNSYGVSAGSDTFLIAVPNLAPAIGAAVSGLTAPAGQTTTVNVTASDAPTDVISLSVTGLPSWASFTDNGDGTGVLTLTPASSNIGSFTGTLTATDNHGASSSTPVSVNVSLPNLRNVYINFNDPSNAPAQAAPWNNTNGAPTAGRTISSLKDDQGATTNFSMTLVNAWAGSNNTGPTTGNNSGVYPDNVMQSFYYDDGGGVKQITLNGLSPNSKYNVKFYCGRAGVTDNRIMHFNIGSDTVSLNAASNTSQTVEIDGITPDASGKITSLMWKDGGAPFAYINAIQLQYSYDTSFSAPNPLTAISPNTSSIQVRWGNNAPAITTGFEVWRSSTPTGPFSLLATVGAGVTSYTDGGLAQGTSFFYEVRALAGTRQSAFTNIAGGSTVAYSVKIQFNDGSDNPAQGGSWNSTNTILFDGFVLPNLINTQSQPTGMNLAVVSDFEGYNDLGTTTGNNSGIYPDNVMQGFFYNDFGLTTTLAITGLNLTSTYNFNFFGSRVNPATSVVSTYQIGNQIVTLNAANNTSQTVQIAGVKPDSTGTIYFSIYNTDGGRCYLNALTIDGVPNPISNFGQTPVATQAVTTDEVTATSARFGADSADEAELTTETKASAFPDPFVDAVSLSLHLPQPVNKLLVTLVDMQGRVLFRQQLNNLSEGTSVVPLGINGSRLPAGSYYLLLQGLPDGKPRSLPLLKMLR